MGWTLNRKSRAIASAISHAIYRAGDLALSTGSRAKACGYWKSDCPPRAAYGAFHEDLLA
jgi:hypothetical protein